MIDLKGLLMTLCRDFRHHDELSAVNDLQLFLFLFVFNNLHGL